MLIGLMGDTHDNLPMIDRATIMLNREKVDIALHTGDYVSPFAIPRLGALNAKLIGVFGNNDGDREWLKKRFTENKRLEIRGNFAAIAADGLKIGLLHGSEEELLEALIRSGAFDVVVHGHSHKAETTRNQNTLIINPGEVCGYLSGKSTIAVLDTSKLQAEIMTLQTSV